MLELQPITFAEACAFIEKHHRHHLPPQGHKFSIGVNNEKQVVGVIVVGRPVSRHFDDGWTAEVTRCCTDGTKNASSMLYSAAWRAARSMGYKRLVTYTLDTEHGSSLKASNWKLVGEAGGGSWNSKSRPRVDKHPTQGKMLWEVK
jgi:hypothetical protein